MKPHDVSRRDFLKGSSAALTGISVLRVAGPAQAFPRDQPELVRAGGQPASEVVPWLDQPTVNPIPNNVGNLLKWESLDSPLTPTDNFFFVNHYGQPDHLDETGWRVDIAGKVARPQTLALADLKDRKPHEVNFTMECSGNTGTGLDFFIGGLGTARWGGARLAPLLEECGLDDEATEVVFWGADRGPVTIRDNSGVVRAGRTGAVEPDATGGLDLTITEQFARSMSLGEALNADNLLCYVMNGDPLPPEHGFPVRLIAPGWYGVANVKWLTRIEIVNRRYAGRFMSRDYVTIREEPRDGGETVWTFATVGRDRIKSAPARVTRHGSRHAVMGAAWGAPIGAVQVQIDDGPWRAAKVEESPLRRRGARDYAWKFWTFDWGTPTPGEHAIRSRAFDVDGNMQPSPDDPFLSGKVTYWESNGYIRRRVLIR